MTPVEWRAVEIAAEIKENPAYLRRVLAYSVIACPRCKVWPGTPCRSANDLQILGIHAARRDALAAMSDDEKVAAYAQEKARQEAAQAEQEARWADPVYRAEIEAARTAWSAAFAAMREQVAAEEREKRERCTQPYYHPADCRCREPGWIPPARPQPVPVGVLPVADLETARARKNR